MLPYFQPILRVHQLQPHTDASTRSRNGRRIQRKRRQVSCLGTCTTVLMLIYAWYSPCRIGTHDELDARSGCWTKLGGVRHLYRDLSSGSFMFLWQWGRRSFPLRRTGIRDHHRDTISRRAGLREALHQQVCCLSSTSFSMLTQSSEQEHFRDSSSSNVDDRQVFIRHSICEYLRTDCVLL